jgi:hypothetical protein
MTPNFEVCRHCGAVYAGLLNVSHHEDNCPRRPA